MTIRKLFPLLLCISIPFATLSPGQDSDDDEVFVLSPFEVLESRGYRSRTPKPAPAEIQMNDIGASIAGVEGLFDPKLKRASGVGVSFAIGFYDDEESVRRETLLKYLKEVRAEIEKYPYLHFEAGQLLVPEGDRKRSRSSKRSDYTSFAHFTVSFAFGDAVSPFERVLEARGIVGALSIQDDVTKVFFGDASLIENSYQDTLLFGVSDRYQGYLEVDELGAAAPVLTDDLGHQIGSSHPQVAVSLVKKADRVRIEFSLESRNVDESVRAEAIQSSLAKAEAAVRDLSGMRFESGSVLLAKGDGSQSQAIGPEAYYAQALFAVTFELSDPAASLERVREVRQRLFALDWRDVDLKFGVAALVVDKPDRYRGELLRAVLADLKQLDDGLGELFEVVPSFPNARVQLRQVSPLEVELWIPYSYEIVSVREREHQRALFELELEKAKAASVSSRDCCQAANNS